MLARHSLASPRRLSRITALAIALLVFIVTFDTRALGSDPIPTVVENGHTYVAVEPLLRDLEIGYDIEGSHLAVNGRSYPHALVEINGIAMANARDLAAFVNLKLTDDHGNLVFGQPQTPAPSHAQAPPESDLDAVRTQLIALLDEHRNEQGVGPLGIDPRAQAAAQAHALDMARDGVLRHVDPDGRTPFDRYHAQGGHCRFYAENVAWYGLADASRAALSSAIEKLDSQMMAERPPDDGHRANIVSPIYDSVGIGIAVGPGGIFLTEDFSGS
ncbi:MAG TPA: CAP domain-containing protein [Candidatus Eremiobacteraceae bacterium]|jgi:uncharacterized protein YkwD